MKEPWLKVMHKALTYILSFEVLMHVLTSAGLSGTVHGRILRGRRVLLELVLLLPLLLLLLLPLPPPKRFQ